jgi:hypothetical protein
VGTLEFVTQDSSHNIHATARTLNGNYSKTFQGMNLAYSYTADTTQPMMIQNVSANDTYRSAIGCFNFTTDPVTVEFMLIAADGSQIGSTFTRVFNGKEFQSFNPFAQAGTPYPTYINYNTWILIRPVSGIGKILCFGATTSNLSNDPAAHIGVQY